MTHDMTHDAFGSSARGGDALRSDVLLRSSLGPAAGLAAWTAAWRSGRCSADDVLDSLHRWASTHRVVAGEATGLGIELLTEIARVNPVAVHVVLPAPGHPPRLPSPLREAALNAGQATLVFGVEQAVGFVPRIADAPLGVVEWRVHRLPVIPVVEHLPLGEARLELRDAVRDAAATLQGFTNEADPRALRAEVAGTVAELLAPDFPPADPRVDDILQTAAHVEACLVVARRHGTQFAVGAQGAHRADSRLADLDRVVRRARVAAVDALCGELLKPRPN